MLLRSKSALSTLSARLSVGAKKKRKNPFARQHFATRTFAARHLIAVTFANQIFANWIFANQDICQPMTFANL